MRRPQTLEHRFVEFIPDVVEEKIVYVSIEYATAVHKCCCGCGSDVVTPLSPAGWQVTFDGESISLYPSIGNWGFKCQSHYWIRRNKVAWAPRWSKTEIDGVRAHNEAARRRHRRAVAAAPEQSAPGSDGGLFGKLRRRWSRRRGA